MLTSFEINKKKIHRNSWNAANLINKAQKMKRYMNNRWLVIGKKMLNFSQNKLNLSKIKLVHIRSNFIKSYELQHNYQKWWTRTLYRNIYKMHKVATISFKTIFILCAVWNQLSGIVFTNVFQITDFTR